MGALPVSPKPHSPEVEKLIDRLAGARFAAVMDGIKSGSTWESTSYSVSVPLPAANCRNCGAPPTATPPHMLAVCLYCGTPR